MTENKLKTTLKDGQVVLGPFVNLASPALIEIAAFAGFDFVILDTEHAPLDVSTCEDLCRVADSVGISPIVRVRENNGPQILRALDVGAAGVQVPQICSMADAQAVVHAGKYAPLGMRGLSPYTRASWYSAHGTKVTDRLNELSMLLVHVEGVDGLNNLDDILSVEGLDVIFLGPYDLSQSLGIPGEVTDSRVVDRMREASSRIRDAGLAVGTFADDPDAAKRWIDAGVQYVSLSVDTGMYLKVCRQMVKAIRR